LNIVKHQYFSRRDRQSRGHAKAPKVVAVERALAHVKYIQHRPGEDRGDDGREMFNDTEDEVDSKEFRQKLRQQENNKVVAHKLTLSPEIAPADKKAYTREIMEKLGKEKGLDLEWVGVAHENTDHHHIHVVVLGKDRNGRAVRIEKEDYSKMREYGDRFMEREHPLEYERLEEKKRALARQRELTKEERIREGLELPWLRKKIIREQLEPYEEWRKTRGSKVPLEKSRENDKSYSEDKIEAAGKDWTRESSAKELRELTEYLWDNPEERISKAEFAKLQGWIQEKERSGERGKADPKEPKALEKEKDHLEFNGQKYDESSSYEKLAALSAKLREDKKNRLPIDEYNMLRGWLENADRARWAGVLAKQLELTHHKIERSKTSNDLKSAEGGRVIDPLQEQVMGNPVVGLFMKGAAVINELVKWVDLTDQRDRLKEGRDALESAKLDKVQEHNQAGRSEERKADDRETIEKLDKAIDQNQAARDESNEEKKRKKWEREDEEAWDKYDPWGRY
jgi:hypothetical protein